MAWIADVALRAAGARVSKVQSQQAPAGALLSPNFNAPHQPQWPTYDGPASIRRGYLRTLYAQRCVNTIANSVSGLDFVAGNIRSKTERSSAPLAQLLGPPPGYPNIRWSAAQLWNYAVVQYKLLGKWAWLKERDSTGRIVGLWPLQAQYLVPIKAAPDSKRDYFEGYEYGQRGMPGWRRFPLDDVAYFWKPSQEDLSQPESLVNLAAMEINTLQLLSQYDLSFLENGGIPAHLITTAPWATKADRAAFRGQFRRDFTGPRNANKVMFAERSVEPGETGDSAPDSVEVHTLGQSQKDSQLDVLRDAKIYDICAAFGVPLSLLMRSENNKYDTADQDRVNYWLETIKPLTREMADMVNMSLGRELSTTDVGWFDLSEVPELRPKPVIDLANAPALVDAQIITADEVRKLNWGLEPLPDDAFPMPALEPAPAEPVDPAAIEPPTPAPTSNVTPIKAARSVRTDQLETLRGLLAVELDDQRAEIERRRDGARGGRLRARAAASLASVYDERHWQQRMTKRLAPALDALGVREVDQAAYVTDITNEVFDRLATGDLGAAFGDDYMGGLDQYLPAGAGIPASAVQAALLQIHAGQG